MLTDLSVLLVDDDTDLIELIASCLARKGAATRISASISAALEAIRDASFDVALLDRKIGFEDGIELARQLRALRPDMPIVMLSGYCEAETIAEAIDAGVTRYLTKPLPFAAIERSVLELTRESHRFAGVQCDRV